MLGRSEKCQDSTGVNAVLNLHTCRSQELVANEERKSSNMLVGLKCKTWTYFIFDLP